MNPTITYRISGIPALHHRHYITREFYWVGVGGRSNWPTPSRKNKNYLQIKAQSRLKYQKRLNIRKDFLLLLTFSVGGVFTEWCSYRLLLFLHKTDFFKSLTSVISSQWMICSTINQIEQFRVFKSRFIGGHSSGIMISRKRTCRYSIIILGRIRPCNILLKDEM